MAGDVELMCARQMGRAASGRHVSIKAAPRGAGIAGGRAAGICGRAPVGFVQALACHLTPSVRLSPGPALPLVPHNPLRNRPSFCTR